MFRPLSALLLALAAQVHAAEQVLIVPSGADNRFELALDPKTRIKGLNPAQFSQFKARIDALTGYLRGLPALTQPPAPHCMRLSSWLEMSADPQRGAGVNVDAHYPISFDKGRCNRVTGAGVEFRVNSTYALFGNATRVKVGDNDDYYVLPLASVDGRIVRMKDFGILLTRQGVLPWKPADRKRYLEQYVAAAASEDERVAKALAEAAAAGIKLPPPASGEQRANEQRRALLARLRAELASGVRKEPVCLDDMKVPAPAGCGLDRIVVEPNPAYWNTKTPERFQLMAIWTPAENNWHEKPEKFALRMNVYKALDLQRLLEMVER